MDKSKLLDKAASPEDRLTLAHVLDKREQARSRNIPAATDFLTPVQRTAAEDILRQAGASPADYLAFGGYDGAERQILLFLPDWLEPEDAGDQLPLRYLRASYRPEYSLTHRDLLGSLMGLGIVREKVGDILVTPDGADLVVLDSVAEFLMQSWDTAGRARLTVTEIGPEVLHIPKLQVQEIRDTVATVRLDAVASTGFRLSRGKAAALIESGKVQVNWRECVKPDKPLSAGDTVTARGLGKFRLKEVGVPTKKGRIPIVVERYV